MNEEPKLPEGLELAETLCGHAFCADACTEEQMQAAVGAICAEHAQRLTLQHHAVDLAQRVADLEKERDEWRRLASAYSPAKELSASLRQATASGDVARKERDELRATLAAYAPHLTEREDGTRYSPADMLALREREVLGLLGRLSAAQMQGDELRTKLAELEQQEPVASAWIRTDPDGSACMKNAFPWAPRSDDEYVAHWMSKGYHEEPLYARPVPATPEGWKLVPVNLTLEMRHAWDLAPENSDDDDVIMAAAYGAMIAAAPEHKA